MRGEWETGYLFVLPATLVIGVFGLFPTLYAIYMSLHRWRIRQGALMLGIALIGIALIGSPIGCGATSPAAHRGGRRCGCCPSRPCSSPGSC